MSVLLGLLVTGVAIAPWTAAAATSCGDGKGDSEIVGRLTRVDSATATFSVEASTPGEHRRANAPLPARGTNLPVLFYDGDEQFFRVGQRYDVQVWWDDGRFTSDVTTAEDICGYGTTRHADGSAIETSLLSRPHVKRVLLATVLAPALILLILAVWLRSRHQKRRRRNDAELRTAAG